MGSVFRTCTCLVCGILLITTVDAAKASLCLLNGGEILSFVSSFVCAQLRTFSSSNAV